MNFIRSQITLPAIGTILLLGLGLLLWTQGGHHENQSSWIPEWQMLTPFQTPRRALAAAASAGYIYVVGGMDRSDHYVAEVEYAPILSDGSLGVWRYTAPLNEPRFYLASVIVNGFLYAVGGANGERGKDNIPSATVERAPILPDGSLGPWQRVTYLTTPRRGLQAAVYRNHIYAIGGYNGNFLKSVERADILQDGSLSTWQLDPQQAIVDRYIHAATQYDDKLYLLGGHERNSEAISYGDVEMSQIGNDGGLRPWAIQESTLKTPRFIATASAMNGYIYMLGGHDGGNRLASVEFAPIDAMGQVGSWSYTTPLPAGRSATTLATQGRKIYVLGGMGPDGVMNTVEMAEQRENGHLGHRRIPQQ